MNAFKKIESKFPLHGLKPMSNSKDLVAALILINYLKPKVCWEIGTGKADWPLFMNLYMNTSAHWHLTENFDWATTSNNAKAKYIPPDWPKNKNHIVQHIKKMCETTEKNMSYNLYDKDISDLWDVIKDPVDLWRIDCDLENADIALQKMLELSSDNVIFFVDDIESNRCINRLCLMMDQVRQGNLDLIFMGKGEAAWVKSGKFSLHEISDSFYSQSKYFDRICSIDDKIIYNKRREYILIE
jgi:hypothetical protein